jgi:hypothetical protein
MIWRKIKKLIIPLIVVKLVILVFLISGGDVINISRDINYSSNFQEGYDIDSAVLKKQKLIRIVRNENDRGISIILRAKKNPRTLNDREEERTYPIVD